MSKQQDKKSYIPDVPWEAHLFEIAPRYPYRFPPRLEHGPHPKVNGEPVPGGQQKFLGHGKPRYLGGV